MNARFHFSYEPDWQEAPLAFWVHIPVSDAPNHFEPQAPNVTPHLGFQFLRFEFEQHELVFSSPSQLEHFIAVLNTKPLPTTRQLSAKRITRVGPNGHWLSRLPAQLKAPKTRAKLVANLRWVQSVVLGRNETSAGPAPTDWPSLPHKKPVRENGAHTPSKGASKRYLHPFAVPRVEKR